MSGATHHTHGRRARDRALLGIDVGGTTVKARLIDSAGRTLGEWRRATPCNDATGRATVDVVTELLARATFVAPVSSLGVVVPGIVDEEAGLCLRAVNLGWHNLPLAELLRNRILTPLAFGQNVRAGALAEAISGSAAGYAGTFAFIPIGTGLASAIGTNGRIASRQEWPGEIEQLVSKTSPHARGQVEEIATASRIARAAVTAPNTKKVADRESAGDNTAITVWNNAIEILSESIASIATSANAALVVVGGGLAEAGSSLEPLAKAVRERLPEGSSLELRPAAHGNSAAIVGATELARQIIPTK